MNLVMILVVTIFALYGLIDDLVDVGRKLKVALPIFFTLPLVYSMSFNLINIPLFGEISFSEEIYLFTVEDIFRFLVIPLYIMVVSNLVNMHSGYNGLQSGLSSILIVTILIKSLLDDNFENIEVSVIFLGSILGFLYFNFYPASIFEGNIGSLLFGSLIGCMIVIQELWFFGFFILLPHTFNFLLWIYWLYLMNRFPKKYLNQDRSHQKFGQLGKDECIDAPFPLTLKWIPNYYFRLDERQTTILMFIITLFFCIIGLVIF